MSKRILVIGACGQVGTELVLSLREKHGNESVIASDIRQPDNEELAQSGEFILLDAMDHKAIEGALEKYEIHTVYMMAAMLSATAEQKPDLGWKLNMDSLFNLLNLAKEKKYAKLFWPSSIAAFGPTTPKNNTPQDCIMDPATVYGISKQAGERWCEYYYKRWGVDVRSVRYPGLISYKAMPGGGTTDYAVEIFHEALKEGKYTSFLAENTELPMLYMPDAIKATIDITESQSELIKIRSSYNLAGFSFSPAQLASAIKQVMPEFEIDYEPDFRQAIAEGWPGSIDDNRAREDWNWQNDYSLNDMVEDMLNNLKQVLSIA